MEITLIVIATVLGILFLTGLMIFIIQASVEGYAKTTQDALNFFNPITKHVAPNSLTNLRQETISVRKSLNGLSNVMTNSVAGVEAFEVRNNIQEMVSDLNSLKWDISRVSPKNRSKYGVVLRDIKDLLQLLPSSNKANQRSVATPFYEKLMEIKPALENVAHELWAAQSAQAEEATEKIKGFQPVSRISEAKGITALPKVNTSSMSATEKQAFQNAMEKARELPLIEGERVKRILADSAEAQALAQEAEKNGEVSFDGHSPEEMVSSILSDNAERLNRTIAEAVMNTGSADRLRALQKFTEDRL